MSSKSGELIITSQETRAGEGPLAYITAIVRFEKYSDYLEIMGHIALGMSTGQSSGHRRRPVCLGEWGAWRSVVGAVTDLYNEAVESDDEFIPFFVWLDHWRLIHMVAGWSP